MKILWEGSTSTNHWFLIEVCLCFCLYSWMRSSSLHLLNSAKKRRLEINDSLQVINESVYSSNYYFPQLSERIKPDWYFLQYQNFDKSEKLSCAQKQNCDIKLALHEAFKGKNEKASIAWCLRKTHLSVFPPWIELVKPQVLYLQEHKHFFYLFLFITHPTAQ